MARRVTGLALLGLLLYLPAAFVSSSLSQARQSKVTRRFKPTIKVEKMSKEAADQQLGVSSWPTWGCGVSKFDWEYSGTETAYILEGEVTVTPTGDWAELEAVDIAAGDLATFPDGMTCIWDVKKPINKHYNFS
ncbi:unnamed protein product [Effrenium voratum]|nr:unnamed protein product [Effrenium voratum]|mmetsp:Transcript_120078/g.285261  ORF Transcript_120078/g.285261 Transcript_120078/m.285261 type:complete len:134 (-) Transcript_120078:3-404(-)